MNKYCTDPVLEETDSSPESDNEFESFGQRPKDRRGRDCVPTEFESLGLPDIEGAQIHISIHNSALSEFPFLGKKKAKKLFELSLELHPDIAKKEIAFQMYPQITVYGKPATMNRGLGFYSDESVGYRFSGQISKSKPPLKWMKKLMKRVNETFDTHFNGLLLNYYPDGEHYIGSHSDDESALSKGGKIISLSLGTERIFRIRDSKTKKIVKFSGGEVTTTPGNLLVMSGDFQKYFKHEIPPQLKIKSPRISLTFREHKE